MKKLLFLALLGLSIISTNVYAGRHKGSSSRHRTYSNQGGHYKGGHGSSHKGGHYKHKQHHDHYVHH